MEFEPVIGLEVHAQLLTRSKMFCGCSAAYADAPPNTHVCPVCMGAPGVMPVINEEAVRDTVKVALALHCEIPPFSKFDRKNYPYPDLVKGYQISQYDMPMSRHGYLDVAMDGATFRVGIVRVHLEEDTAKLLHRSDMGGAYSLMDINRSGVPLIEIVSAPDIHSPEQARAWDEARGETLPQRTKEFAHDYRYFPEPDLPPLEFSPAYVEEVRASLPELADARRARLVAQYGLPEADAATITASKTLADFYEDAVAAAPDGAARDVANRLLSDVGGLLNAQGIEIDESKLTSKNLAAVVHLLRDGT